MKNWKTTVIGIIAGTLTILQATLTAYQSGTPVQWLQVILGIVIMAFGIVAKDFNVTGAGTAAAAAKITLTSLILMITGCGIFGTPTPKAGQCFDWCIVTEIVPLQDDAAICYGSEAEMLKDKAALEAQGKRVTVRK